MLIEEAPRKLLRRLRSGCRTQPAHHRAAALCPYHGSREGLCRRGESRRSTDPATLELTASGYYYIPFKSLGLAGITVTPTATLLDLQKKIIEAVAPFTEQGGGPAAFVGQPETPTICPTAAYVDEFVTKHSGEHYNPHVTVGLGKEDYVKSMGAEPFGTFSFKVESVSIYRLGDLGTAQKKLWSSKSNATSRADP